MKNIFLLIVLLFVAANVATAEVKVGDIVSDEGIPPSVTAPAVEKPSALATATQATSPSLDGEKYCLIAEAERQNAKLRQQIYQLTKKEKCRGSISRHNKRSGSGGRVSVSPVKSQSRSKSATLALDKKRELAKKEILRQQAANKEYLKKTASEKEGKGGSAMPISLQIIIGVLAIAGTTIGIIALCGGIQRNFLRDQNRQAAQAAPAP